MARSNDPKKLALWQGRFQRFVESGLPVVRFCAAEHVSESSFYYWQKKLGPPMRRQGPCEADGGIGAEDRGTCSEGRRAGATGRGVFRPVAVVPAVSGVVVRLPNGTRIEVDARHIDAVRAVVAEAWRSTPDAANEQDASSGNHVFRKRSGAVSC